MGCTRTLQSLLTSLSVVTMLDFRIHCEKYRFATRFSLLAVQWTGAEVLQKTRRDAVSLHSCLTFVCVCVGCCARCVPTCRVPICRVPIFSFQCRYLIDVSVFLTTTLLVVPTPNMETFSRLSGPVAPGVAANCRTNREASRPVGGVTVTRPLFVHSQQCVHRSSRLLSLLPQMTVCHWPPLFGREHREPLWSASLSSSFSPSLPPLPMAAVKPRV